MSSSQQDRPVVTLYPSSQEDVNVYMAAIRLASSVRNSMDAQKASADGEKGPTAENPTGATLDALELHQGHFPPPEPPIGSTPAPPIKSMARRTGPIPIHPGQGILPNESASGQLYSGDAFSPNALAIRSIPMCEAPTGFAQRVACGHFEGWLVLGFFVFFLIMGSAWMKIRTYRPQRVKEENEGEGEGENGEQDEAEI